MKTDKKFAAEGGKRAERPQLDAQNMRRSSAESRQRKRKPFARSDATIFFSYHSLTACTSLFRTAGSIDSFSIQCSTLAWPAWHLHGTKFPPTSRPAMQCIASMLECFACRDDASSKERNRRVARIVSCDRAIRHPTILVVLLVGIESYMSCIGSHIRICHAIIFIVITLYSLPAT